MKEDFRPFDFKLIEEFPDATRVAVFEGGMCFIASKDDGFCVIIDGRTFAEFLDGDDLAELVRVITFPSAVERDAYVAEMFTHGGGTVPSEALGPDL